MGDELWYCWLLLVFLKLRIVLVGDEEMLSCVYNGKRLSMDQDGHNNGGGKKVIEKTSEEVKK